MSKMKGGAILTMGAGAVLAGGEWADAIQRPLFRADESRRVRRGRSGAGYTKPRMTRAKVRARRRRGRGS